MPHLPQELLEEIFSYLPPNDRRSLRSCSLVSKSWLDPSRRFLFSSVGIDIATYRSWLDNISPKNVELLRHVRSLEYFTEQPQACVYRLAVYSLLDYLPSFSQLRTLALRNMHVESTIPDNLEIFFSFQHTLSSLTISKGSITWRAFMAIVGYFPNLRHLEVRRLSFQTDNRLIPRVPHFLRGRLVIELSGKGCLGAFIDKFCELKPGYEELVMHGAYQHRLAAAVEASLKYLRIHRCAVGTEPDLSNFSLLRELELTTPIPDKEERILVSSITSINFRKVVFAPVVNLSWEILSLAPDWDLFDNTICELTDKLRTLGSRHTIEVEIRVDFEGFGSEEQQRWFLPMFKEKGRVRVVSVFDDRFKEWP